MTETDERISEQYQIIKAKHGIISLNFLGAIVSFEAVSDLERSFLSPLFIGSLLILIVIVCRLTIHKETADDIFIYVKSHEEKRKLNRQSKFKRFWFWLTWMIFIILTTNVIVPMIYKGHIKWEMNPTFLIFLPIYFIIFMLDNDKRIQITEQYVPSIEERDANPKGMLRLIPNYRFADEQQKQTIINTYASNYIWIVISLTIIVIIDCVVELFMHHWPLGSIITILFLVVSGMILAIQFYRLKKQYR
ncbi:Uncharacterised protein [Staphylococcus petrasii]|uniref:DUF3169 family protein n=1 Tax=Staphylococcus petrasii TaxID=1276936 RepID=A0A380FYE8_9STAP|nr:hypothetical protein [Staphylococcus petrasii]PNZ33330.1 hypothetical protein CD137_00600 [Staphylococcus petrasii]TGE11213.1 hypothetical protein E2557_10235 [Staphylococcus petrasii]TGE19152.1 hypothetical protein BJR09_01875 [Staphylococcus petrasii]SUM43160.1 Uncharacterised protein [Staphylococcus petrasii]